MQADEREQSHADLWKSQEDERVEIKMEELRTRARKYEIESTAVYWTVLGLTPIFIAVFVRNVMKVSNPWVAAGQGWMLALLCVAALGLMRSRPRRLVSGQSCIDFLRRVLEGKRLGLLWIRRGILLLAPAILASWWGGGPLLGARSLGIRTPWLLRFVDGPGILVILVLVLTFVWFAFFIEARKVDRELEKLKRDSGGPVHQNP